MPIGVQDVVGDVAGMYILAYAALCHRLFGEMESKQTDCVIYMGLRCDESLIICMRDVDFGTNNYVKR